MPDDPQLEALKLPPHSLEAEQSILGGLLLDNEAADRIGDLVYEEDFYSEAHRLIYRHIVGLSGDGKPVDVVTSLASRISARSWPTCRPRRTSDTTRKSCASARFCVNWQRPPARSPIPRTT